MEFKKRLSQVENRYQQYLNDIPTIQSFQERNRIKRELHCENELIRLDIELNHLKNAQQLTANNKSNNTPSNNNPASNEELCKDKMILDQVLEGINCLRDNLLLDVAPADPTWISKIYCLSRMICYFLFMFGVFFGLIFCIPLRMTHPLLRRLGIPNNYLPFDLIQWSFCRGLLCIAGIQVRSEQLENMMENRLKGATVCMFSHTSNLDGVILQACSPTTLKFIGKKSIFLVPAVGWVGRWGFGSVPIDRSNRKGAVRSLKRLAEAVDIWGRSVAISPEGTRSKSGQISDFKKGPFYLQEDAKKPITPAIIFGAYELYPPSRLFTLSGKVTLRFLPQFTPDPTKSRDENRLALRRVFLLESCKAPSDVGSSVDIPLTLWTLLSMPLVLVAFSSLMKLVLVIGELVMLYMSISWTGLFVGCTFSVLLLEVIMYLSC